VNQKVKIHKFSLKNEGKYKVRGKDMKSRLRKANTCWQHNIKGCDSQENDQSVFCYRLLQTKGKAKRWKVTNCSASGSSKVKLGKWCRL